ncbi:MAG: MATE family efflux transporter [Bacteroidales bacterium]|nr:MATE family efflux transporter [Bacteroidales bacterium]
MNKKILNLAIPNIITNITVPLLGMVDLAIAGHIGDEKYIGAVSLGATIFNLIYWNFGFLRMGTSGFTAQAYGAQNKTEAYRILVRSCFIALIVAIILIALQGPIAAVARLLLKGGEDIRSLAISYFFIRIWAAPATLGLYAIKGWFIGMQNSKFPMIIAIALNIVNILFSLLLAVNMKMGIEGIAWGTVIAQYSGLLLAVIIWLIYYRKDAAGTIKSFGKYNVRYAWNFIKECIKWKEMRRFFKVNSDIFFRTNCLVLVFTFIPVISSRMGDMTLAINTLLMQLFTLFSYIMDGFAYAGEALVGKYIGAKDKRNLRLSISYLLRWGGVITLLFTVAYLFWGNDILSLLTDKREIIAATMRYSLWSILIPITGFAAFLFDGIYIGATASKTMRNTMFIATGIFFLAYFCLVPFWGNNGLWIAFLLFLSTRGGLLWALEKKVIHI